MEFKDFVIQLGQVHEAISVNSKHYTDIHVSGNFIEFTRESQSHESIDIQNLFDAYEKENHIDTTILRKYIKGWKYSPALAILKAAGFYNEKGVKVKFPFKEREVNDVETATFPILVSSLAMTPKIWKQN